MMQPGMAVGHIVLDGGSLGSLGSFLFFVPLELNVLEITE